PSGKELQVYVLDVGPVDGDAILIISPTGKTALIDAGDTSKGKAVLDALKKHTVQQIDYFIATHPHPDHIGGASEVLKGMKVGNIIDNGAGPNIHESLKPAVPPTKGSPKAKPLLEKPLPEKR